MNDLVERVAKAIDAAQESDLDFKADWPAEALARAAIAAMREFLSDQYVMDWPAVIDAALKETKDEIP